MTERNEEFQGTSNTTTILLGFRKEDNSVAHNLCEKLLSYGGRNLEIIMAEESRDKSGWPDEFLENLKRTDLVLLLVDHPQVNTDDWTRFQHALTLSEVEADAPRIMLCNSLAYCPSGPEKTLTEIYISEASSIENLLRYVFDDDKYTQNKKPLNTHFANSPESVCAAASEISTWFHQAPPPKAEFLAFSAYCEHVVLIAKNPGVIDKPALSPELIVKSDGESFKIFGLQYPKPEGRDWLWKDLYTAISGQGHDDWIDQLGKAVHEASQGKIPTSIEAVIRSPSGFFKPMLVRSETWNDGSKRFYVYFVKQIGEGGVINAPTRELATLLTASILGARLQWSVCNLFIPQLNRSVREGNLGRICQQIRSSYLNIERDAEVRRDVEAPNQKNEDRLAEAFSNEVGKKIRMNLDDQFSHKKVLRNLDESCEESKVRDTLSKLASLNKRVLLDAAYRYYELLVNEYGEAEGGKKPPLHQ